MSLEIYRGTIFDSREEVWFAMWCQELKERGYIYNWYKASIPLQVINPLKIEYIKKIELKTKTRYESKEFNLLKGLSYTPDFYITWTLKGLREFVSPMSQDINPNKWFFTPFLNDGNQSNEGVVEVKPTFDQHGKTARFSIIQKIVWDKLQIFVDLIIVEDLFKSTFMPAEAVPEFQYKIKAKKGQWKCKYIPKTLKQFLNEK